MATKTIDVAEAQQQLTELLAQVAAGTEIILTDGQTPRTSGAYPTSLYPADTGPASRQYFCDRRL